MKKAMLFLLVVISLFACVSTVFAKDASEMIGTITSYVEEIQSYPEALRDACGTDMFKQKLSELANLITSANDAMAEAGLPNSLNLWAVYSAVTSNISDCSFFTSALSKADWSREELDRIGYQFGLYDSKEMGTVVVQCLIKGNISSSKKEKIYHLPGQQYYEKTIIDESKGERWFCTEEEAIEAGWRKSLR